MKSIKLASVAVFALSMLGAAAAQAKVEPFVAQWSGSAYGDTATATGYFLIDTSVLPNVGPDQFNALPDAAFVVELIRVTGATLGNGTFDGSDFYGYNFATPSTLDLTRQLIGQALSTGYTYGAQGAGGDAGDFNVYGMGAAPTASSVGAGNNPYFNLVTDGAYGDPMALVSLTAVPEPATWSMMILGLGALGLVLRRRATTAAA